MSLHASFSFLSCRLEGMLHKLNIICNFNEFSKIIAFLFADSHKIGQNNQVVRYKWTMNVNIKRKFSQFCKENKNNDHSPAHKSLLTCMTLVSVLQ